MLDKFEEIFKDIEIQSLKSIDAKYLVRLKPLFYMLFAEIETLKKRIDELEKANNVNVPLHVISEPPKDK